MDLRPYCDTAPYTVYEAASVPRAYRLFRTVGMRHLLVLNSLNELVGIITRDELLEENIDEALAKRHGKVRAQGEIFLLENMMYEPLP